MAATNQSIPRGELPFAPRHVQGWIFETLGGQQLVMWQNHDVEPIGERPAAEAALDEFRALLSSGRPPLVIDDKLLLSAYESFRLIGSRTWSFQSGTFYQQVTVLLDAAKKANARRTELVQTYGGKEPSVRKDLTDFYEATTMVGAACNAISVLAMASVEAFANEVLSAQYNFTEGNLRNMHFIGKPNRKIDTLLARLDLSTDFEWYRTLQAEQKRRSDEIVHCKPAYVDSDEMAVMPLRPSDLPDRAALLVSAVHDVHVAVFSAFGQPVLETHWGWAESADDYWTMLDGAATRKAAQSGERRSDL